ncbi:MAG TPA: FHA domain-containing protein, partial [Gemmatimonadales bacterium]|nr:FHA domain-containing protein [Gemmatimonadales bacterium]
MPPLRLVSTAGDQTFELPEGRTLVVGRGVSSDIAIYDPTISRRHAELTVGADGVDVKDVGSSNGTCINGTRVAAGHLGLEDTITFGKVSFRLTVRGSGGAAIQRPAIAAEVAAAGGKIVRQLVVS